ncbi:unnamed protein product [Orchesella dallaii]|uniref:Uncharacterized protein n=1 Tax=Orchesella dallaii TaxID=48710 RepID=A0ABP1S9Q8_9HEXA
MFTGELCCTLAIFTCSLLDPLVFPLAVFIFPCHQFSSSVIAFFKPDSCFSLTFQIISFFIEGVLLFIPLVLWGIQVIVYGITVQMWNGKVKSLKSAAKFVTSRNNQQKQWKTVLFYRKCQVYTSVINAFSQQFLLPAVQVFGAAFIIAGMYTVIISDGKLPMLMFSSLVIFTVVLASFCFVVLDVSSKGLLYSKSFINTLNKWPLHRNGVFRRYIKSLPCLKLYMGPFHAVDRGRGPALLKFCLQRTMFFVFKSRAA